MAVGAPHTISDMDVRAGIQAVAQRLLGSADQWVDIAAINSLEPPYLTFDPVKAFGLPLDKQSLPSALSVGSTQISISLQQQLWTPGNNVVFAIASSNGIVTESQTITSYDGTTLKWQKSLQNYYPQGSLIATYPAQVFQNKVLMPGQVLYLPITQANSFVLSQNGSLTDVFGADAKNPITWENGDIAIVSGLDVLLQRISSVLGTPLNSLPQAPTFGQKFRLATGSVGSLDFLVYAREALLELPEISQVTDLKITKQSGTAAYISGKVWVYTSKTPLELINEPLTLPITQ